MTRLSKKSYIIFSSYPDHRLCDHRQPVGAAVSFVVLALWKVDLRQVLAIFVEGSPAPHILRTHKQVDFQLANVKYRTSPGL